MTISTTVTPSRATTTGTPASPRPDRGVSKHYGSGDAAVAALDDVSVAPRARASSPPSWGPRAPASRPCCTCSPASTDRPPGEVYLGDTEITSLNDKALTLLRRDRIGFIFQSFNLLPTMTAAENIVLPMRIAGPQAGRRTGWPRSSRPSASPAGSSTGPAELSGGQQQRVAAARALASSARRSSSPTSRPARWTPGPAPSCSRFLRTAVDELGQTVVMVTHDPTAAATPTGSSSSPTAASSTRCTHRPPSDVLDYMKTPGSLTDVDRNPSQHGGAQAAPRPHHGVDRTRRRPPGRNADPHQHHGHRLRPALRQDLRRHRRGGPHRGPVHRDRGRRHQPRPDRRRRSSTRSATSTASARPRARSAATPCSPTTTAGPITTNGGAPTNGYSMPADEELRGDVELLTGHAPDGRARGRHRRHQRRGARHRARLDHQGAVPGPDPGVHRRRHRRLRRRRSRTSAAPRRRTSTPRPRSRCSGTPGMFDAIDVSAEDGVSQSELADRLSPGGPRGHRGASPATRSPRRTPTRPRRTSRSSASSSGSSPASRCSSARSSSGTRSR